MPIALVRIDDRLVHGQVVEGWIPYLKADTVVVISNEAAADPALQALMQLGLPGNIELRVLPTQEVGAVADLEKSKRRVLVLAPGPKEVLALMDGGIYLSSVNVGGMHYGAGRIQLGRVMFLSEDDRQALKTIATRGVTLEGRAVPLDQKMNVADLL